MVADLKKLGNVDPSPAGAEHHIWGNVDPLLVHKQESIHTSLTLKPSPCCQVSPKATGQVGSVG